MEAPNAPNPENPNAQGDPGQSQAPAGPPLAPGPVNQYHNWSQHNRLLLVSCLFLKLSIKIG